MTFHVTDAFRPVTLGMQSFEAARLEALRLVGPVDRSETVPLGEALGRVLAETVVAPRDLPAFDQAAMDGYAVRFADVAAGPLRVDGVTHAGDAPARLTPNCAHRIMTGASLPAGADTVVPYEETTIVHDGVAMLGSSQPEGNVRKAGEDIARGQMVLAKGRRLAWPEIAALAALGIGSVRVTTPVRVSIVTTGAELRSSGEALPAAGIYDSNGPMLMALLAGRGVDVTRTTVGDNYDALVERLAHASRQSDLVVTSAGMSAGDRDLVRAALAAVGGTLTISSVAIKPGKPLALGAIGAAAFVGLPGNPQAAAFSALAFVRPMIAALSGRPRILPVTALSAFAIGRPSEKTELLPVTLEASSGRLTAHRVGQPGSHRLMPLLAADALAIIPAADTPLKAGDRLEVLPFHDPEFQGVPS
ncbi:Putative competence-damage inducible protein [Pleomorphomonas sp. T1.2MG-36]|uniref:molybdopterin molybdotransferase MoeA n=1 Tax=Pleomorphomonas sp. T1.2MG-36 TaxID=3041167 RepID=UPI002477C742|nr:gephyrin-like molybdotransferase Glp [Pleomorphomonas sp. T1.2MG-36]CAI9408924.1 Putative competence-damage inducible protein [Pleomorphomonas sp. T1.2MG-36]